MQQHNISDDDCEHASKRGENIGLLGHSIGQPGWVVGLPRGFRVVARWKLLKC